MKSRIQSLMLTLLALFLAACGSGMSGNSSTGNAVANSQGCLVSGCHATSISKVTGGMIADEWKKSVHYRMNVAGCADCHDASHNGSNHCSNCHGRSVPTASGGAERCGKCHGLSHQEDRLMAYAPQHFGNMTASGNNTRYRASYVSLNYIGQCKKCHNPHDPSSNAAYNANWARSGHGDTLSGSRGSEFKARGNTAGAALSYGNSQSAALFPNLPEQRSYCVRCHTTTGYINFVTSGFVDVSPFPTVVNKETEVIDKTKEVTACDACHTSYAFNLASLRRVPQVTVYYNHRNVVSPNNIDITNNAVTFPDAGFSNMCIPCHSARQNGNVIKLIAQGGFSNFTSLSRVSSHDFGGSASLFKLIGYEFEGLDYTNKAGYKHDSIGLASGGGTPKGPCIMCHLNTEVRAESHLYMPVSDEPDATVKAVSGTRITEVVSRTCATAGCHVSSTIGIPWTTVEQLQAKKAGFYAAMQALLEFQAIAGTVTNIRRGSATNPTHSPTYTSKWTRLRINGVPTMITPSAGHTYPWADNMGATFNFDALKADPGAFAHNDVYTKRLIYDSLEWLRQSETTATSVKDALDKLAAGNFNTRTFAGATSTQIRSRTFFNTTTATNAKAWLGGGTTRP